MNDGLSLGASAKSSFSTGTTSLMICWRRRQDRVRLLVVCYLIGFLNSFFEFGSFLVHFFATGWRHFRYRFLVLFLVPCLPPLLVGSCYKEAGARNGPRSWPQKWCQKLYAFLFFCSFIFSEHDRFQCCGAGACLPCRRSIQIRSC